MCKDEIKRLNAVISKLKDEMINLKKHLSMLEWNDKYKEIGI